ncbi:MAG: DUF2254 domain-containing protein [Rhodothermales bacterium]|nr:DUF2254 domain-containing protein [Rhodothermales bacterium]
MPPHVVRLWDSLRSSYWFIPTVMSLAAFALAVTATAADGAFGSEWLEEVPWLAGNKPDGARAVLSTVAGSMITVAGVVFSVTIAAVSYASGQYGPRLLTQFLRDTGNQVTLGTFIATFVYCLHVLRTVRSPDEVGPSFFEGVDGTAGFVPHIGMLGALALAICSIGVLIYFIHHVPQSIHISIAIANIGQELLEQIEDEFPEPLGQSTPDDVDRQDAEAHAEATQRGPAAEIRSTGSGYVQGVDDVALLSVARQHDLVLRLRYRPGDFVQRGRALLDAWPADRIDDVVRERLRGAFATGRRRTPVQDLPFLVEELVEIAARALSPGVNDPFTATRCLDWLGAALASLAQRDLPDRLRYDADGRLRAIAHPMTFADYVEAAFGRLRPYVSSDRNAALHTFRALGEIASDARRPAEREALRPHVDELLRACERNLPDAPALDEVRGRHRQVLRLLSDPESAEAVLREQDWLGGRT